MKKAEGDGVLSDRKRLCNHWLQSWVGLTLERLSPMNIQKAGSYLVTLEDAALRDLLLPIIECCVSPPVTDDDEKPYDGVWEGFEVDGFLWGYISENDDGQHIIIQKAAPLISSLRSQHSVRPAFASDLAQENIVRCFWPQLIQVGHFHSHPYMHLCEREVTPVHYDFSRSDIECMKNRGLKLYVLITVCRKNKDRRGGTVIGFPDYPDSDHEDFSLIRFELSDLVIWIRADVREPTVGSQLRKAHSRKVGLHCPSVLGFGGSLSAAGAAAPYPFSELMPRLRRSRR